MNVHKWLPFLFLVIPGFLSVSEAAPTREGIAITSTGKVRRWKKLPVLLCAAPELPGMAVAALTGAVKAWNNGLGKRVFETGCRSQVSDFEKENLEEHSVFWVRKGFGKTGDPLGLARTLSAFDEDSGEMIDADILLNAEHFDFASLSVDLKSVLIHELGHVLGLQHLFVSQDSVMNQYPYQSGIIRHRLGEYELRALRKLYCGSGEAVPAFIDAYFAGNIGRALELVRKEPKRGVESYYSEGMLALAGKDPASAAVAFGKALSLDPKNVFARYRLSLALSEQGKAGQAKSELEAVLRDAPKFYEALADLGFISMQEGRTQEATRLFRKTLEVNPVHYPACIFLLKLTGESRYRRCVERYSPVS